MLKRLGLGLLKGLLIGGAIGAAFQLGLGWHGVSGLLGFLIAMGVAGTTGVFAGKPPWREGAWIEATLKGLVGVGIGALLYWASSRWGQLSMPFPGLSEPESWTAMPAVFGPAVAAVYGSLVELDNTGEAGQDDAGKKKGGGNAPKARVAIDADLGDELEAPAPRASKKRRA
jgi:hypothetical protein